MGNSCKKPRRNQFTVGLPLIKLCVVLVTIIIGIGLGIWQAMPPSVPSENAPHYPAYKSMLNNIKKFAVEPHPSGSPEIEKVRSLIVAEIEDMGLTPIVENYIYTVSEIIDLQMVSMKTTREEFWEQYGSLFMEDFNTDNVDDSMAALLSDFLNEDGNLHLKNIFVKLESAGADSTILFVSHYDSERESPGASDSMLSVCSRLEAMRYYANNADLKTNLYFLFTDAEEPGLFGAYAFIAAHPEMKDIVDLVVNMDMGGVSGALLFDYMPPKAYSLVKTVLKSGARPMASSLAVVVCSYLNGGADILAFYENDYDGVNMSASVGKEKIHTPADTYQSMNKATAWHFLQITLAIADYAASNSLANINNSPLECVYFPFLPRGNILMTVIAARLLAVLTCALALSWVSIQIKHRQLKVSFPLIIIGILFIFTVLSVVFLIDSNYLFSIPLLFMTITMFFKKLKTARVTAGMISGIVTLILWTPVVYLVFAIIIKPMMA